MLPDYAVQQIVHDIMCAASFAFDNVGRQIQYAADEYARPSVVLRPGLSISGNQWRATYQRVTGVGDSPDLACRDFDKNWYAKL
jgi:hypothetical protein